MSNPVVQVNVSIQIAPPPAALQKTGALVSQGGTVTSPGTISPLTQLSDLTPLLAPAKANTSINYVGGAAEIATASPHNFPVGDVMNLTVANAAPAGYNGTYPCTITGPSSFQYALPASPGAETAAGTYQVADAAQLVQQATTFFAQGSTQGASVIELGPGGVNTGVAFLTAWIAANPQVLYGYIVPREWDGNANFIALAESLEGPSGLTYFWVTTTLANYQLYAGIKSILWLIEAPAYGVWPANPIEALSWAGGVATAQTQIAHGVQPGQWFQLAGAEPNGYDGWAQAQLGTSGTALIWGLAENPGSPVTAFGTLLASAYASAGVAPNEFSLASGFRTTLNYSPSSTNKVPPLNFAFEFGVTPFPGQGNAALISTILAAGGNLILPTSAGSVSPACFRGGKTADGMQFKWWYAIDWAQINLPRNMTAVLENGANNTQNPIDYNQDGINALQASAVSTMTLGLQSALVLDKIAQTTLSAPALALALDNGTYDGNTLINADPFGSYVVENPGDYPAGVYDGISVDFTPLKGFEGITINMTVSNFATG